MQDAYSRACMFGEPHDAYTKASEMLWGEIRWRGRLSDQVVALVRIHAEIVKTRTESPLG